MTGTIRLGNAKDIVTAHVEDQVVRDRIVRALERDSREPAAAHAERIEDLERELRAMARGGETSDGRPPATPSERLDEVERAAREARADTKDGSAKLTISARVARLEEAVERGLGGDVL